MKVRHPTVVLHSFSMKDIFYDKIDLKSFHFHVTTYINSNLNPFTKACSNGGNKIGSRNDHKNHPNHYGIIKKTRPCKGVLLPLQANWKVNEN